MIITTDRAGMSLATTTIESFTEETRLMLAILLRIMTKQRRTPPVAAMGQSTTVTMARFTIPERKTWGVRGQRRLRLLLPLLLMLRGGATTMVVVIEESPRIPRTTALMCTTDPKLLPPTSPARRPVIRHQRGVAEAQAMGLEVATPHDL